MDDFSKYPKSISELKGVDDAAKWSPREAIISILREIDNGELDPSAVVVIVLESKEDGHTKTSFRSSGPNLPTSLGMMEIAKFKMMEG